VRKEYLPKLAPFDMKLLCDQRLARAIEILSDQVLLEDYARFAFPTFRWRSPARAK